MAAPRNVFTEKLFDSYGQQITIDKVLIHKERKSENDWEILIFENEKLGKVFTIDGTVQLTTSDEANYHEMMAHIPLFAHNSPKRVLIIGGGDGGLLREVVKHKSVKEKYLQHSSVEEVVLVEISEDVIKLSKEYFPEVSNGAFADPRVKVVYQDGFQFVKTTKDKFDVILVDSTDAIGPGAILFSKEFYAACGNLLNDAGIIVTQSGSASWQEQQIRNTYLRLSSLFGQNVSFFHAQVPSYPGGQMYFGWARKGLHLSHGEPGAVTATMGKIEHKNPKRFDGLKYYHPGMHQAAFILPQFMQTLIRSLDAAKNLSASMTQVVGTPPPLLKKVEQDHQATLKA